MPVARHPNCVMSWCQATPEATPEEEEQCRTTVSVYSEATA